MRRNYSMKVVCRHHGQKMHKQMPSGFKPVSTSLGGQHAEYVGAFTSWYLTNNKEAKFQSPLLICIPSLLMQKLLCFGSQAVALKLLSFLLPSFCSPVSSAQVSFYQNPWHAHPQNFFSFGIFSSEFERQGFPNSFYWEASPPILPYW